MDDRRILNAKVTGTMLGYEDHGILSAWIYLDHEMGGQGFGGYCLDEYDKGEKERMPMAYCGAFVQGVLRTLEVGTWEKLKGTPCRIDQSHSKIFRIGHFLKEEWFNPEEVFRDMRERKP